MTHRSQALADRVQEGAGILAAFADRLSDPEWKAVVPKDGRTVGQVVHHVALVYPIEVDLARAIAQGKAVTDVTWDVVATLNADNARKHAAVTKAEAVDLLRRNSQAAADAIRGFSDAELDTAAAFSLSYGAPMTAQFVIEDHAVRHSWHHLARLRTVLGK
jgi:DinB superfamily